MKINVCTYINIIISIISGELAQSVEHSLRMREASGSKPEFSTFSLFRDLTLFWRVVVSAIRMKHRLLQILFLDHFCTMPSAKHVKVFLRIRPNMDMDSDSALKCIDSKVNLYHIHHHFFQTPSDRRNTIKS